MDPIGEREGEGPLEAFRRYTADFQALDPRTIAKHCHEPLLQIAPRGVRVLPDGAAVEAAYQGLMADLRARGYARTEFSHLAERRLDDDLALVSCDCAWKGGAGEDLGCFGATYTIRRTRDGWRIVVLAIHAAGKVG
ncbi:MAG TPA: hypothetical protein VMK12_01730 [Anaeromyxobacteraceae bacterium]|nr:hypothetical protein [Anaeromyxobacteraceae bacterium]